MTHNGDGGELIKQIHQACDERFPLVDKSFGVSAQGYLRSRRLIVDAIDLEAVLHWITPDIIGTMDDSFKDRFRNLILLAIRRQGCLNEHDQDRILKLPIFKELTACQTDPGKFYRHLVLKKNSNFIERSIPRFAKANHIRCLESRAFQYFPTQVFLTRRRTTTENFLNLSDIQ